MDFFYEYKNILLFIYSSDLYFLSLGFMYSYGDDVDDDYGEWLIGMKWENGLEIYGDSSDISYWNSWVIWTIRPIFHHYLPQFSPLTPQLASVWNKNFPIFSYPTNFLFHRPT